MSAVPDGTYSFGPGDGQLLVKVFREGVAARVGHDLVLEAQGWSVKVVVGPAPSVEASVDVASLTVVDASGGAKPLSRSDRADIKRNIEEKVLSAGRFPTIAFQSSWVTWGGDATATLAGELTIMGATRPVEVALRMESGRARASFTVVQSQWGIKPFSALMGALKVRDAVDVTLDVALPTD